MREPWPPPGHEPLEGFGAGTAGGYGGRVIAVREASEAALRRALEEMNRGGHATLRLELDAPVSLRKPLPRLTASRLTIEGGGATLDGAALPQGSAILDIRARDVIVRDLRLRNGDDNLRIQGPQATDIVVTHVSSTGARDDGISIGYGARDVTVQYVFLAGNTRSVFCKYGGTSNVSLHHSWLQKAWARSPLFSGPVLADVRNVIVEDWGEWGARFEQGASGNVVASIFALSPYAATVGGKPGAALRWVGTGRVFTAGNVFRGLATAAVPGDAEAPLPTPPVRTDPVAEMEPEVRARAGCLPRDATDAAYVERAAGWRVGPTEPLRLAP